MVGLVPIEKDIIPMVLPTSTSAGPSSAFRLANSSSMVFLSFAVRRSWVFWACCWECRRQAARLSFAKDRGKNTDGYQRCGYSVLKQQIPKICGERRNLHAAPSPGSVWWCYWRVSGTYDLYGDVQFNSDGDLPLGICPGFERWHLIFHSLRPCFR